MSPARALAAAAASLLFAASAAAQSGGGGERPAAGQPGAAPSGWRQHELNRPHAPAVTPAADARSAPSDAIVLFDGRDLSAFERAPRPPGAPRAGTDSAPTTPGWKVENGYVEVVPGTGTIRTKQSFGDIQLHAEWASPTTLPDRTGQNRGNSGFILMGQYEIQVLDSYRQSDTYADGAAGSVYGQYPPLVNASRPPGEWQTYDIYFRRPRFRADGTLREPARVTVVHNGVLVQNNEVIYGPTSPVPPYGYTRHADELPLTIQDHSQPVRFRNIWVRRIGERPEPAAGYVPTAVALSPAQLRGMAGSYYRERPANAPAGRGGGGPQGPAYTITVEGNDVYVAMGGFGGMSKPERVIPSAPDRLWFTGRAGELVLTRNAQGVVTAVSPAGSNAPPAVRRE